MYGHVSIKGICNYRSLDQLTMTDEILQKIGLTREQYRKMRKFPVNISQKIVFELAITPKMLDYVGITI